MSSRLQTPVFKKDKNYEVYRSQLQLWRECTDLAKEKQGIFVYLSLPDDDETKIKERALDELSASELKKENGLDKLIEFFDKHLKKDDLEEEWAKYNDFGDFSREDGMNIEDFVSKFDSLYNKLVKCEIKIPPQILAFRLLKKANLTKDECLLVMSGLDYSDKSRLYDQAKKSLKKFKGDGAVGVTCGGKDSDILVAQGGRYVPPMFRGNSRPFQSGLGRGRGYSRPFVVNRPGSDGKPMRCRGCESIGHLIRDCPHVGSRPQAHFADVDDNTDFYEETICLFSVEESCQFLAEASDSVVLDTGCSATVCGNEWLEMYLSSLSEEQRSEIRMNPSNKMFKFGAGGKVPSEGVCMIPGVLVGRPVLISTDVVKSDIPMLLSRQAMKKAGVKIDTSNDSAEIFGTTVQLNTTTSGHYSLPLREIDFDVFALDLGAKDSEKKASLLKLHRQFAHPPTAKLLSLLKDAGLEELAEAQVMLDDIRSRCEVCKRFASTPARPSVCLPLASRFNEKVAMDLKKWNSKWILHLIDMWSRLTLSIIIDRKKPSMVIDKIMKHWVGHFGLMGTILHDNGGEFSNDEMRAVCSTLNVEICTTAANSPWQNGLCERVHAVTDCMLLKLSADHPTIPLEILLCWANMARNSLQMWNGFSSYQLVFGINPNVPNVMTDKLPALDARTSTQIFNDHLNALHAARRAFMQSGSEERIRRALRTKVQASEESYVFGDKVFYKRDGSEKWLGPAKVMFQDGRIVFLRHGGVVVRVSPNRLVKAHQRAEDESDKHTEVPSNHKSEDKMSLDKSAAAASDSDSYSEKSVHEDGNTEEDPEEDDSPDEVINGDIEHAGDKQDEVPVLRQSLRLLNKEHGWEVYHATVAPIYEWQVYMNEVPKALHSNPECMQAKEEELQKLQLFDVYEETEDHGQVCIGTRWVLTYKGSSVKARLVAKGFQEKERVPSDSPTVAKTALRTLMALAASNCWEIMTTDIKSAFLQGKEVDRDIFIRPPKEANVSPGRIWRLKKTLYGLNDGSRQYYLSVREFLISCGCEVSSVDPSVFFYMHAGELSGVIVSHVDDFLHSGSHLFNEKVMEPLRQRFIAGKVEAAEFKYVGFAVRQGSDGIQLNMDEYIDGIHLTKITPGEEDRPLTEEEASEYRSIVGRLN